MVCSGVKHYQLYGICLCRVLKLVWRINGWRHEKGSRSQKTAKYVENAQVFEAYSKRQQRAVKEKEGTHVKTTDLPCFSRVCLCRRRICGSGCLGRSRCPDTRGENAGQRRVPEPEHLILSVLAKVSNSAALGRIILTRMVPGRATRPYHCSKMLKNSRFRAFVGKTRPRMEYDGKP